MTSLGASMASSSEKNGDHLVSSEEFVSDESNLLSLHPWIFKKESYQDGMNISVNTARGSPRSRMLRRFSVKPVNFMGNYITPFGEHVDIEEYVLASPPNSPTPRFRPLVISDGSRIISKSNFDSFGVQPENGLYKEDLLHGESDGISLGAKRAVIGAPLHPHSLNLRRKSSELQHVSIEAADSPVKVPLSEGSHDGMLPFVIGISVGMISAHISKRTEVDKLNKLLKQSEDLVQDLQEELELKDSFSVKELAYCTYESQQIKHWNYKQEESTVLVQNHNLPPRSTSLDEHDQLHLNKAGENPESLRKIEAELEAELERLEQNMNMDDCRLEQRMSHLSESDLDLVADAVHGELRADNLVHEIPESPAKSHTGTSTTQTYNANYCVSPKELSLRLHQVIQSRLEERIQELERELLQGQMHLHVLEAERQNLPRTLSNSDVGFSSNQESPPAMRLNSSLVHPLCLNLAGDARTLSNSDVGFSSNQETPRAMRLNSALVHPFCLNLAGEALDAYDEAYQEFMHVTGKEDSAVSPINKRESIDIHISNSSCSSLPWESILWSRGSNETPKYEDEDGENDSFSDEEGKALIQQLVEKTKRGSPAVINAQRMFLLMDE